MTPERILETRNGTGHALDEDEWVALCDLALKGLQVEEMREAIRRAVLQLDETRVVFKYPNADDIESYISSIRADLSQALNERKET